MTDEDTTPDSLSDLIAPPPQKRLSMQGKIFLTEYFLDYNAARSARVAGYKSHQFPNERAVVLELEKKHKELAESLRITPDRVLKEFARVGFVDTRNLFNEDGTPKSFMELTPDVRAALAEITVETQGKDKNWTSVTKYKMVDKLKALDALAKHLKLYPKDTGVDPGKDNDSISDMSDNEKARRVAHMLHRSVRKMERNGDVEDAVVIEQ